MNCYNKLPYWTYKVSRGKTFCYYDIEDGSKSGKNSLALSSPNERRFPDYFIQWPSSFMGKSLKPYTTLDKYKADSKTGKNDK